MYNIVKYFISQYLSTYFYKAGRCEEHSSTLSEDIEDKFWWLYAKETQNTKKSRRTGIILISLVVKYVKLSC